MRLIISCTIGVSSESRVKFVDSKGISLSPLVACY